MSKFVVTRQDIKNVYTTSKRIVTARFANTVRRIYKDMKEELGG